jgi:hypothetical protein
LRVDRRRIFQILTHIVRRPGHLQFLASEPSP